MNVTSRSDKLETNPDVSRCCPESITTAHSALYHPSSHRNILYKNLQYQILPKNVKHCQCNDNIKHCQLLIHISAPPDTDIMVMIESADKCTKTLTDYIRYSQDGRHDMVP